MIALSVIQPTEPYPPLVAIDEFTGDTTVLFARPDENDKVLFVRFYEKTKLYSFDELGIDVIDFGQISTAGYDWHVNCIAAYIYWETGERAESALSLRFKNGQTLFINTSTLKASRTIDSVGLKKSHTEWADAALILLDSDNPQDRLTGIIHSGQMRITDSKEKLQELLGDEEYYITGPPNTKVYYIQEAAQKALKLISE